MGCKQSKEASPGGFVSEAAGGGSPFGDSPMESMSSSKKSKESNPSSTRSGSGQDNLEKYDKVYKLLAKCHSGGDNSSSTNFELWKKVIHCCDHDPMAPNYLHFQHPTTKSTPLHLAVRLIDLEMGNTASDLTALIQTLVQVFPNALNIQDAGGNIPLHYAIAPSNMMAPPQVQPIPMLQWKVRQEIVRLLISSNYQATEEYMKRNDIVFDERDSAVTVRGGCTPLYRVLQTLPDDFEPKGCTFQYMAYIAEANPNMAGVGNHSDGDKPLCLLYRRFTRQFDISEKFFAGDNSRPEVVEHRRQYKIAAGNTWKIIELLLRPTDPNKRTNWRIVHRAVQIETPPDLLRYIVETNPEDLTQLDQYGNSPLHYAAKSKPAHIPSDANENNTNMAAAAASFPSFYTKYVIDELLYKFPEGAKAQDASGFFPLTLAINSGKQWIGGGIKSLYDAYPDALKQTDLDQHLNLKRVLSLVGDDDDAEKKVPDSVIKDEQHDAIMLVQQEDVEISEVVTSMWAHEEDAGVQMLGCVAVARLGRAAAHHMADILRISLSAVAAVVNAMKAHPNEVIVQEKACHALKVLAPADGLREVSFVASGAVAAIVGAMQAHVGDAGVQEEACGAIAEIVRFGGADRATIVASVSGITAIVNAIAAHPDMAGVQRDGCLALREITGFPNANIPELPSSQTAPLLEEAKSKFPVECGESADIVLSRLT